ncbi:DnaJ C-terminal domain-containing protein [Quadrisphaera sp. DSM 44207]|uniref:DnaJ C-terminal domain-containing protein n=1 Tax=Quadrisphaera sp. DSM 44207 TaxID=1881057 RepID=UPI0008811D3A|nr:DnaJ C-terminal domain-containing protein [Quadrisphaera sp. DSM 44207]SDQ88284.1 molecular chaperone DnaJ [Quadrisphaera sp. DSM 44207]
MTGQDWLEKDFYAVLGVSKDASADEVKKAYRKLARTLHPDANPGDASAEARFKEVGEAYAVLSDPEQRQQYDAVRAMAGGRARFTAAGPGHGADGFEDLLGGLFGAGAGGPRVRYETAGGPGGVPPGFEDLLGGLFSGAGAGVGGPAGGTATGFRVPTRGADLEAEAPLPFADAVTGTTVTLRVEGRTVTARIPAGVRDGQKVRLRGQGRPSPRGGEPGDLLVAVRVQPHPVFTREGDDLKVVLPVTFPEAALGADVDVPTLDGSTVRLRIAPGTPSGRTLRVRGRGVSAGGRTGDLLVTTQVVVPQRLDPDARKAVEAFRDATADGDPRAELLARARAGAPGGGAR